MEAIFTLAGSSSKLLGFWTLGLTTQSTAPSASAAMVVSVPRAVIEETMTTGIGLRRITFSRNEMPSISGISTSRVMTSGLSILMSSRACSAEFAVPTTSISGSASSTLATS